MAMETPKWPIIDFFQALSTGLPVGGTYGLMCVGLGIHIETNDPVFEA